jgi:type VI secretion system protein ImpA
MPAIDIDSILAPISTDDPCGPNLEYDPAFAELDRLAAGKPEQQIGATLVEAEEPDWKGVQKASLALLARSKDLRAAGHLANALLRTAGWVGFADGLGTLGGLIDRYWAGLHPRLDPDDGNDPTMRVNVLAGLTEPALIAAVRNAPLVSSRTMGRFSLRDLEIATGEVPPPPDTAAPQMASLEAAIMDCDLELLEETTAGAKACVAALTGLETSLGEHLSAEATPSLSRLTGVVRKAAHFLGLSLARRKPSAADGLGAADGADSSGFSSGSSGTSASGGISSREDVLRALDRICAYYAQYEPSSPVPMFMERSKRLVTMSFVDIVKELIPDALGQVEVLRGSNN